MARRRIGQERLGLAVTPARKASSLDEVAALTDWAELDRLDGGHLGACQEFSAQGRLHDQAAAWVNRSPNRMAN